MKKIVLTFGLIAGAIMSLMLLLQMLFKEQIGHERGMVIGYTSMVLAFLLIFFGIRSYRDNVGGGTVRFGRAVAVGMLIAVIASVVYTSSWQVIYRTVAPNYMTEYQAYMLEKARAKGESPEALAKLKADGDEFNEMYKNPLVNFAFGFVEPLPVAVIITLVSAAVLSRRREPQTTQVRVPG